MNVINRLIKCIIFNFTFYAILALRSAQGWVTIPFFSLAVLSVQMGTQFDQKVFSFYP